MNKKIVASAAIVAALFSGTALAQKAHLVVPTNLSFSHGGSKGGGR